MEQFRRKLLSGASVLTLAAGVAMPAPVGAAACSGASSIVSVSCTGPLFISANSGMLSIVNGAVISGGTAGVSIAASATVGTVSNDGTVSGGHFGLDTAGGIGTLNNSGTISGTTTNGLNLSGGTIGVIRNSGAIVGHFNGVASAGGIGSLINQGSISGGSAGIDISGSIGTLSNAGTISGGFKGVYLSGTLGTLANDGSIGGGNYGVDSAGLIGVLNNRGTISGVATNGISNSGGVIGTLSNSGAVIGGYNGIANTGSIGTVDNSGLVSGGGNGFDNEASIGTLSNSGTLSGGHLALYATASSSIGTVSNDGTMTGGNYGISNSGTIGALNNAGTISGVATNGISNSGGLIGTLSNAGFVSGGYNGIANAGVIGSVGNSGTVSGGSDGIANAGTIGTLSNAGTIVGVNYAIYNTGSLGSIIDSGLIAGDLFSPAALTIAGGSGGAAGTLTGYNGSIGAITATGVTVTSGTLLLGDDLSVGGGTGTVLNSGATIEIASIIHVSGNYSQTGGALILMGPGGGIVVSGTAGIAGAGVSLSGTNNYLAGSTKTLISAGSLGGALSLGLPSGLAVTTSLSSTSFTASYLNDYVGGSLDSILSSGLISGVSYGVYVAATGSLGSLVNSGTILGSTAALENLGQIGRLSNSSRLGTVLNAASGRIGTLDNAGVIDSFANVGSVALLSGSGVIGALSNSGSLRIDSQVSISGNYVQSAAGTLAIGVTSAASYGHLAVTQSASLSGMVTIVATSAGAIKTGETFSIVSAGTLSASSLSVRVAGFADSYTIVGNQLLVSVGAADNTDSSPASWSAGAVMAGDRGQPMGAVLDSLSSNTAYQALLTDLALLPASGQAQVLRQLGVNRVATQIATGGDVAQAVTSVVEHHQYALLSGDRATGRSAGSAESGHALWGQVLGGVAERDGSYRATSYGLLIGGDLVLAHEVTGGVGVSWLRRNAGGMGEDGGSRVTADSYQVSLYGEWRPRDGAAYLTGLAAVGLDQYTQKRNIDLLAETAHSSFDGQHYQAKLGGGYDLLLPGPPGEMPLTLTPLASFQYVRTELASYGETGAGPENLSVRGKGFDSLDSDLGARVSTRFALPWATLAADVQAGWVHAYANAPVAILASMGGVDFVTKSARLAADGARLGLGASLEMPDGLAVRLEYDGDYRADYRSHAGLLRIRQLF